MPRKARQQSSSGMYHVILRGINRQTIFEDDEDCEKFLSLLLSYKNKCGYTVYAWCLMGNHIHLLLKIEKDPIGAIFRKIASVYAVYFNTKYERVGHLFQDRFKSEPVEDDTYFLQVLRYIHMNPVKARMCKDPKAYEYSSYREYIGNTVRQIADTKMALSMLGKQEFIRYTLAQNDDVFLDVSDKVGTRLTDEAAKEIIKEITGCKSAAEFQMLNNYQRDDAMRVIIRRGVMVNQAARLTGWSRRVVIRALEK